METLKELLHKTLKIAPHRQKSAFKVEIVRSCDRKTTIWCITIWAETGSLMLWWKARHSKKCSFVVLNWPATSFCWVDINSVGGFRFDKEIDIVFLNRYQSLCQNGSSPKSIREYWCPYEYVREIAQRTSRHVPYDGYRSRMGGRLWRRTQGSGDLR